MQIVAKVAFDKIKQIGAGQGLNSTVWLARDPQLDCELAVKEIDKLTFWNPDCFSEAQAVYASDHPNVVRVQWAGEEGQYAYIAMPYYPNGSLADVLASGPMQLSSLLVTAQQVLLGLGHIHSRRFIHLDIKPSNILFDYQRKALLADFGQSRRISPSGGATAPPLYYATMPPEFLQSGKVARVSDIFQVGTLLYRAANGEQVWQHQISTYPTDAQLEQAIVKGKFPNRDLFLPHVPKRLRTAIRKALSVVPGDRFSSATELGQELGRINPAKDWAVSVSANSDMVWLSAPNACAQLEVEMKKNGSEFRVTVHTRNGNSVRKKGENTFWGTFPDVPRAFRHLKWVFESL